MNTPFYKKYLDSNSCDDHLADTMAVCRNEIQGAKRHNKLISFRITGDHGFLLLPGRAYSGITREYAGTRGCVRSLEWKSSIGRSGIDIHSTACKDDIGYCDAWTLDVSAKHPVMIYPVTAIGLLNYFEVSGSALAPYNKKPTAKYNRKTKPWVESMVWKTSGSKLHGSK